MHSSYVAKGPGLEARPFRLCPQTPREGRDDFNIISDRGNTLPFFGELAVRTRLGERNSHASDAKENRAKVKEHSLTFPVVLQQQWEISRLYAMFATPIAYLINEQGIILHDVAVGVEPILALMAMAKNSHHEPAQAVQ